MFVTTEIQLTNDELLKSMIDVWNDILVLKGSGAGMLRNRLKVSKVIGYRVLFGQY